MFLKCRIKFNSVWQSSWICADGSAFPKEATAESISVKSYSCTLYMCVNTSICMHTYIYESINIYDTPSLFHPYTRSTGDELCLGRRITPWLDHGSVSICLSNSLILLRDRLLCSQPRWRNLVPLMKLGCVPCLFMFLFTCLSHISILKSELVRSAPLNSSIFSQSVHLDPVEILIYINIKNC